MDYQKHYYLLCEKARNRSLDGYKEGHHVIPRCRRFETYRPNHYIQCP